MEDQAEQAAADIAVMVGGPAPGPTATERQLAPVQRRGLAAMEPRNFEELLKVAELMAKSRAVPKAYADNPGAVIMAAQMGAEIGFPMAVALQWIVPVNGKLTVWGDGALALVRRSPEFVSIEETMEDSDDELTAVCTTVRKHRDGRTETTVRKFSLKAAKRANLTSKDGPWQAYPARMMQMRARAWTLRDGWADVLCGLAIKEEVEDYIETAATPVAIEHKTAAATEALKEKYAAPQAAEAEVEHAEMDSASDGEGRADAPAQPAGDGGNETRRAKGRNRRGDAGEGVSGGEGNPGGASGALL
jgi:hypothetical protein